MELTMRRDYAILANIFWQHRQPRAYETAILKRLGVTKRQISEERLRRLLQFSIQLATVYPVFHGVLSAIGGQSAFKRLLAYTWDEFKRFRPQTTLIADTFHPHIVSSALKRFIRSYPSTAWLTFASRLFQLELARYRAEAVANGQPDPAPLPRLAPGADIIMADFDLPGVFGQCKRLVDARVPAGLTSTFAKPVGKPTLCVVYADPPETVEHCYAFAESFGGEPRRILRQIAPDVSARIVR
jgi:hypothetical protein